MSSSGNNPEVAQDSSAALRILLTGTFCALNKGDAAMHLCAARALQAGGEITILSPHPEIDRQTYLDWPVVKTSRRNIVPALTRLARVAVWRALDRIGIDVRILLRGVEIDAYHQSDLLVDLSGDTIAEDYGVACVVSHLVPLLMAALLGRRMMICAQSIGPFRFTRPLVRFALSRAALITAREEFSFNQLQAMRLRGPALHRTNDIAFLLEPAPPQEVNAILAAEGIDALNGPCLGAALTGLPGLRRGLHKPHLVELFASVADDFIDATGANVSFIAHVTGPGAARDDREMHRAVHSRMRNPRKAIVVAGDYRPEELKGLIGRCAAFMGLRMHANIAALGSNVPTLAIAYSRKAAGIMKAAGQQRHVCDVRDADRDTLGAALGDLWRDRDAIREDLRSRQAGIQSLAAENFRLAEGLLTRAAAVPGR